MEEGGGGRIIKLWRTRKIKENEEKGIQERGGKIIKLWRRRSENIKIAEEGMKKLRREIIKLWRRK